jgi:hypothetical protein
MNAVGTVGQVSVEVPDLGVVDAAAGVVSGAIGSFLLTLLVGAVLLALSPGYVERRAGAFLEDPVGAFVYGFLVLVLVGLTAIVLVITLIGILVAIPLIVVTAVLVYVGSAVAFLAIGDRLVGGIDERPLRPLAVGAAINGGLALTGVGGLVALCVSAAGFGVVVKDVL